jgi:hypothetical protein
MQHDFILLDGSGSMISQWDEAIASINTYVHKLVEDKVDIGVTLAVFDTKPTGGLNFRIVRDKITPGTWRDVTTTEEKPGNYTPLNDATGRIVNLAFAGNYDKVAMVIITDGIENASKEMTLAQAKAALESCRSRDWQVIFLGANFDNIQQAHSYGGAVGQTVNSSSANLRNTMSKMSGKRAMYGSGAAATMDWSSEEQEEAKKQ